MEETRTVAVGRRFLLATVFLTGMSIMGIEMSASRLLAPYFGTSLIVWTNIIGLIMVSLSVGYYYGGSLADRHPDCRVLYRIIFFSGIFVLIIPLISAHVMSLSISGSVGLFVGSLLAIMALFVVPFTLLGMVSPFAIRLASQSLDRVGNTAGSIYALSTVGSIIGTYLPALCTIPLLGTRYTILLFAVCLLLVGAAGLFRSRKGRRAMGPVTAVVVFVALGLLFVGPPGMVKAVARRGRTIAMERESPYNFIQVQERTIRRPSGHTRTRRLLMLNEGFAVHSVYDPESPFFPCVGSVWDYFGLCSVPLTRKQKGRLDVCIVGLAAGTISKEIFTFFGQSFDIHIDGVEIDPEIIEVGREYFGMNEPNLRAIAADGRVFLNRTDKKYDIIITDAYRQPYIPFQLTTKEYFSLVRDHLEPGGIAGINVGSLSDRTQVFRRITSTLASVFPHVGYFPASFPGALFTNYIVYAGDEPLDPARFDPRVCPLLARLAGMGAWQFVVEVLSRARSGWRPYTRHPDEEPLTDDLAPVEYLTDWLILQYVMSGKGKAALENEMGRLRPSR